MLEGLRWWIAEQIERVADFIDPERIVTRQRTLDALRVLEDIARGKIKPEDARQSAYAALY